jgi:small subunit ribosomal protein S20
MIPRPSSKGAVFSSSSKDLFLHLWSRLPLLEISLQAQATPVVSIHKDVIELFALSFYYTKGGEKAVPNIKSAVKRMRIEERNRLYNRHWKSRAKSACKDVLEAVTAGDLALAKERLSIAYSVLDKATIKGVLHRNTVARKKSRLMASVRALDKSAGS